ncbi:MAG: trypsin-like peptidase domain-containing protein [Planctomycetes bacterium]|nr:trypsin-like peptidase domain-containing protein [Planctomycetota bacterium]
MRADLLLAEDAARATAETAESGGGELGGKGPVRFAEVLPVELDLENSGVWEELGRGDRVWRLRIHSRGAKSLALVFEHYHVPAGGELYLYDDKRATLRGAFTEHENRLDGQFAIRPLRGDALNLEYFEPARARGRGRLALSAVTHDYLDVLGMIEDRAGGGTAQNCEIDVTCPLGASWANQIDAAVRVMALPSGLLCSGSLLNSTANDGTILVLSAAHCTGLANAVFLFNFERPGCRTGTAPMTDTITGSTPLVGDGALDVQLVRLNVPQGPLAFPAYLAGWDRSGVPPTSSVLVHHPAGDVKKISLDDDPPGIAGNLWRILDWEAGVSEGGSSGAPLFDPAGRFIGNLDSGSSTCVFRSNDDFCTRLAAAWPLLEPYLDPLGTGQLTLDGLDLALAPLPQPFDVTGLFPSEVEVLAPGRSRSLRILGTGFRDSTQVTIDGTPLDPARMLRGGHGWLNLDMPQLALGPHAFKISEGAASEVLPFAVVAPSEPRFEVDEGVPDDELFSQIGADTLHADQPGHLHVGYLSLSGLPSIHPRVTLALGNQFTNLHRFLVTVIPRAGWASVHHAVPPGMLPFGTVLYSQTVCISHGLPLHASNRQESIFQF